MKSSSVIDKIEHIKQHLRKEIPSDEILQKHLIERQSYYFLEHHEDAHDEYKFRSCVAKNLNVNINDVVLVGSAKLGFSLKSENFTLFDQGVDKKNQPKRSDIDVAIINRKLFDDIGYQMSNHFNKSWINEYWLVNRFNNNEEKNESRPLFNSYTEYFAKGWFRPDFSPEIFISSWAIYEIIKEWQTQHLQKRKVGLAVYSNWDFFKHYHMDNFEVLRAKIFQGDIF